jgi:hypothetical protein
VLPGQPARFVFVLQLLKAAVGVLTEAAEQGEESRKVGDTGVHVMEVCFLRVCFTDCFQDTVLVFVGSVNGVNMYHTHMNNIGTYLLCLFFLDVPRGRTQGVLARQTCYHLSHSAITVQDKSLKVIFWRKCFCT